MSRTGVALDNSDIYIIYYDYYCMFSAVATLTFPRVGWGKLF